MRKEQERFLKHIRKHGCDSFSTRTSLQFAKTTSPDLLRGISKAHRLKGVEWIAVTIWCPGEDPKVVEDGLVRATKLSTRISAWIEEEGREHIHLVAAVEDEEQLIALLRYRDRHNKSEREHRPDTKGDRVHLRRNADLLTFLGYVASHRNLGGHPGSLQASHGVRRLPDPAPAQALLEPAQAEETARPAQAHRIAVDALEVAEGTLRPTWR